MSKREIAGLLAKARRSVHAAERLLRDDDTILQSRAPMYGMFYVAQAMLLTREVRRSKHSGVIAAFHEAVCETRGGSGSVLPSASRWI